MKTIVLATGGYDPLHSGHIAYFEDAKKLGDILIVGVNSDEWLSRKKGQPFMNQKERVSIVSALKSVDSVITFDDSDGSAINAIKKCLELYPDYNIIFANGGDRTNSNIPEMYAFLNNKRVIFKFGVGGEYKQNSSSQILNDWTNIKTYKQWGYYKVLYKYENSLKVKELVVEPGKSLSYQRHFKRSEYWMVAQGTATLNLENEFNGKYTEILEENDDVYIPVNTWHQLVNNTNDQIKIIEIQYGINCIEEDIERK